ncbi:MAG: hypothetical protein U9M89_00310 [Patescibacteria group bacterium]|nr:hypothetical protein [Patescibacteria group bacterium]
MNDHYGAEFIAAQKEALDKEKVRLEGELSEVATFDKSQGRYVAKYKEFNPDASEDNDEATDETVNFVENESMANELIKSLSEVNDALKAMDEGNYGKCVECNDRYISEERLKAYPAAKTCVKCGG